MKKYFLISILIILGMSIYLTITTLNQTMVYYLTVSEFLKENPETSCRVNGKIMEGSVQHKEGSFDYIFKIADDKNFINVKYTGVVSDIFKDGIEVVVEGKYDKKNNIFIANNIITKCPSKYEAAASNKSYYKK